MGVFGNTFGDTLGGQLWTKTNQNPSTVDLVQMFDGTMSGSELVDKSPLGLNALISNNCIHNSGCEYDFGYSTINGGTKSISTTQKHSGTNSLKYSVTGGATSGIDTATFYTQSGKNYTIDFWIYIESMSVASAIRCYCRNGTGGGTNGFTIVPNTIGSWQHVVAHYTEGTTGTGALFRIYVNSGDAVFYIDDIKRTSDDTTDTYITLQKDTRISDNDSSGVFFSNGNPLNVRMASLKSYYDNKVFNNITNGKMLLYSIDQYGNNFLKAHDFIGWNPITSITNIKTVKKDGTGDYLTIQAAITSITDATIDKKYRIDIYDDWTITQTSEYQTDGAYKHYIILKNYIYLNGVGSTKHVISFSIPSVDPTYGFTNFNRISGVNNLRLVSQNVRYTIHDDAAALLFFYNCEFESLGPEATVGEGTQNGGVYNFYNCSIKGVKPYQSHDNTGFTIPSKTRLTKCQLIAPASSDVAVLIQSIGNAPAIISKFELNKCTKMGIFNRTITTTETYILTAID